MKIYGRTKRERRDEPDTQTPNLVNNILFCYEGETHTGITARESSTFYNIKKHSNNKDESKSTRTKVSIAAITRIGALG